jgi:hypothetical protein
MLDGLESLSSEATRPLRSPPRRFLVVEPRGRYRRFVASLLGLWTTD